MKETLKLIRDRFDEKCRETCHDLCYMLVRHPVITSFSVGCVVVAFNGALAKRSNEKESSKESES